MPRLTHANYSEQGKHLREIWYFSGGHCSLRTSNGVCITSTSSPKRCRHQADRHRHAVTAGDPSLPHRAGRAFAKLNRGEWSRATSRTVNGRTISVRSVVRPEPDLQLLAK